MRAGDLIRVDFGVPIGSEAGLRRPAVVVTADAVLESNPTTIHVVPVTSNVTRRWPTEIPVESVALDRDSVAQCHLGTTIDRQRIESEFSASIGTVSLAQVRSVIADLLDIP